MSDLYASRAPVRLNDGAADANNAGVTNAAPSAGDYALETRQVGFPAAAALADAVANPTLVPISVYLQGYNGSTWDRLRSTTANGLAVDVTRVTGTVTVDTELPAAAALADAVANPTTPSAGAYLIGYNGSTWDRLRSTTANGLAVDVTRVTGTVTVDTELPAAAALADASANPTTALVGADLLVYNGSTWDRLRSTGASDGNGALTTTGIAAVGIGPGYARRFNPSNLGTATNSASTVDVNGGEAIVVGINTSTTGTYAFEASADATNWVAVPALDIGAQAFVTGNITPTLGKAYSINVAGLRQFRLRTTGTLGATMAHFITITMGAGVRADASISNPFNLAQVGGASVALGQTTMANSIPVAIASNQSAITVDTELTAVATLGDGTANPTISNIASLGFVYNGTTWDRARGAATLADALANPGTGLAQGQSFLMGYNGSTWDRVRVANTGRLQVDVVTGAGGTQYVGDAAATSTPTGTIAMGLANSAAPTNVSANNDAVAAWMLLNGSQVVNLASGGTLITVGSKVSASSIPVVIASDQGAVAVDTELAAAAAQADAVANPTIPNVGAFLSGYNGTTWDRLRSTTANGLAVDVTRVQGTVTVDTELPAAAALADGASNPTVPGVGGFLMGYNGSTWDRVRTANTGRLQVDVITGGGSSATGVPSGYTLIGLYGTSAAVAGGATQTAVVTNTPANTKPFYVKMVHITASGQTKWQVKFGATVLATGFNPQTNLSQWVAFDPPLTGTGDGATALTVDITNREASAMDVYAALRGYVLT